MHIIVHTDFQKAIEKAKDILYEKVNKQTVLFLSGGATPKSLYASLAKDAITAPAAVALVDERQGNKMHEQSNEKMIAETGFLEYLKSKKIPFYPMLPNAAQTYDQTVRNLFFHFPKSIAVMGIGTDGHIAGIPPEMAHNDKSMFVVSYENAKMVPQERITLTFAGLSLIDFFVVLAFGKEKKKALQEMFTPGPVEEIPARFFVQQASQNTVVITDQQI